MTRILAMFFLAGALGAGGVAAAADEIDTGPAMTSAQGWLGLIDGERYGASWDGAAESFRTSLEKSRWETMVGSVRAPLGGVISRKVRSASFTRAPGGAPEGEYVVIQYDTRFENRPLSTETVTMIRDQEGWRTASYGIR